MGVVWLLIKVYIQYSVLVCPYCSEPFSKQKWLADVPHRCSYCDRIIDENAPEKFKMQ
ncbi:MAG: hypothetical protein IJD80_03655 [Oscillospiraceae bacterium]|nr:hypothetical protein [Oscillospiraceae bacterium]